MISVKISLKFVKQILHITVIIKNWIIGYCNSRDIIGLAIMGYKPLFYVCAWRQVKPEVFWYNVTFHLFLCNNFGKIYLHFGAFFNETIIPLALVGYIWDDYSQLGLSIISYPMCACRIIVYFSTYTIGATHQIKPTNSKMNSCFKVFLKRWLG